MNNAMKIFSRTTFRSCSLIGLLLLVIAGGVSAEETLTLEEARSLAEANSPTLQSASLEMDAAELEKAALKYDWYPRVSLSGRIGVSGAESELLSSEVNSSVRISLSQQIWDGGKSALQRKLSGVGVEIAASDWESTLLDVRCQCDQYFFAYLEAADQEAAAEADLAAAEARLAEIEGKLEAGMISRASYLEARADAAGKETALLQKQRNTFSARAELASYLGLDELPETEYSVEEYTVGIEAIAALDEAQIEEISGKLIGQGLAEAPELLKADLAEKQALLTAAVEKKEYAPTVSLSLSDQFSPGRGEDLSGNASISLSASITLSQWKRGNTADQAEIAVQQSSLSSSETRRTYVLGIESAWNDLISAARTAVSAGAALEYAEELYKETLEMYNLSAGSLMDLRDAEATLVTNRNTCSSARFDYLKSVSNLVSILALEDENLLWEIIRL